LAGVYLLLFAGFASAGAWLDPAAPDAVGPLNCATATPPVVAYDISKGQTAADVQSFAADLGLEGFTVGTINGSIPACVDVLIVRGLIGTQALSSPYSAGEAATIKNWVDAGHGLMVLSDWGTLTNGVNAIFVAFGYTQTQGALTDADDYDPIGGSDWVIYQSDNFAAHPIVQGVAEVEFLRSSWFAPAASAIIVSDANSNPASKPVMAAFASASGCAVLASDSDWVADAVPQANAGYFKRDNDVLARQTIHWLDGCGRAPTALPGGPYAVNEGSSVTLNGAGSYDPNGDPLSYAWDLDNDAQFDDAFIANPTFSAALRDDGMYTVSLRVSDGEYFDVGRTHVTVLNVAPAVVLNGSAISVVAGAPITFTGSFGDPGVLDTHVLRWNFGDGAPNVFGALTRAHTYASSGVYTTTLTVTDDDGGAGQASYTVVVTSGQNPPITARIRLPLLARNYCNLSTQYADIALVVDTSGSMNEPTKPNGPSKLDAAKAAITTFINLLVFPGDQASLVSFDTEATLEHILSNNRASLIAALQDLQPLGVTRIDLGLALARAELTGPRHLPANVRVVILLTDGHPNGTDEQTVLAEADATKALGITLYTIGLGNGVKDDFLRQVASSPAHYYASPDADQLNSIYQEIEGTLHCP
jgi:Mg-chelatase subunit ChlD